jgi:hypothetical protein
MTQKLLKDFSQKAVDQSLLQVFQYGRKSPRRVKHIHYWVRNYIQTRLGNNYRCYSYHPHLKADDKEIRVAGRFYPKNSDITICNKDEDVLGVISVKFIMSNYKQNANNYFESMIGECYNLKANNIKYGHIMICPYLVPYYNNQCGLKYIEKLNNKDITKYAELNDSTTVHKPDMLSFNVLKIKNKDGIISNPDLFNQLSETEKNKTLESIKNKSEIISGTKIDKHFDDPNISKYLKENHLVNSLDRYINDIQNTTLNKIDRKRKQCDDNKEDGFINRIIKRIRHK